MFYRNTVIGDLQTQHSIVMLVSQNLAAYISKARIYAKGKRSSHILLNSWVNLPIFYIALYSAGNLGFIGSLNNRCKCGNVILLISFNIYSKNISY